jgi:hypothetical protein
LGGQKSSDFLQGPLSLDRVIISSIPGRTMVTHSKLHNH